MPPKVSSTGNILVNPETGEKKWFPQSLLKQAITSGEWQGQKGDQMLLLDQYGAPKTIDASDAGRAFHLRFNAEARDNVRHREKEARLEGKYGDSPGRAFAESALRGVTFGLSDPLLVGLGASAQGLRERKARTSGWITGTGEIGGLVGSALLTGGGSLLARGATAGAKKLVVPAGARAIDPVARKTLLQHAAGETAKREVAERGLASSIARWTPAGAAQVASTAIGRAAIPAGAKVAGTEAFWLGTATGLKGTAGRMIPYSVQAASEGAMWGAGHAASMAALSEDPLTAEAFWSELGQGALWGGAFGAGFSVLADAGRYLKGVKDKGVTGRAALIDDEIAAADEGAMAYKDLWTKDEAARTGVKTARKAEKEAGRTATATEKAYEKEVLAANKNVAALGVKYQKAIDESSALRESTAIAEQKAADKVVEAERNLERASLATDAAARGVAVAEKKAALKEAKDAHTKAQKTTASVEKRTARNEEIVRDELEAALAKPVKAEDSKLAERLGILRKLGMGWKGSGYRVTRGIGPADVVGIENTTMNATNRVLNDALDAFDQFFWVGWEKAEGFTRKIGLHRTQKVKGARIGGRIAADENHLAKAASQDPAVYKRMVEVVEDLEAAIVAHTAGVKRAHGAAQEAMAAEIKITFPKELKEIIDEQFHASEYMKTFGTANKAVGAEKGKVLDALGMMEVAGTFGGEETAGDKIGDVLGGVPLVGGIAGTALEAFLHLRGAKALGQQGVKAYKQAGKEAPLSAVASAKGALKETQKQAALEALEDRIIKLQRIGKSVDEAEIALSDAADNLTAARQLAEEAPGEGAALVKDAEETLRRSQDARDALASNRVDITEAKLHYQQLKEATSLAEAQAATTKSDLKFGKLDAASGKTKKQKQETGMARQALTNGLSASVWLQTRQKFGRGLGGTILASILSGGARKMASKKTLDTAIPEAYVTTKEKISNAVGSFIGIPGKTTKALPFASSQAALDSMTFGPEKFKGERVARMTPLQDSYYRKVKEIRRLMADPESTMSKLMDSTANLRAINPSLANKVANDAFRRVIMIANQIPQTPPMGFAGSSYDEHIPSDSSIAKFARYALAAWQPMSVMDKLSKGNLTKEEAEALRETSPEIFMQIQEEFVTNLSDKKNKLSFAKRIQLSILFDLPADSVMSAIMKRQSTFMQEEPQVNLSQMKQTAQNQETNTQRRAAK